jgi:hypothetical protein
LTALIFGSNLDYGARRTSAAALLFLDDDNPLRASASAASSKVFLARRHIDFLDGDVAVVIQREQLFGYRRAPSITRAGRLIDT